MFVRSYVSESFQKNVWKNNENLSVCKIFGYHLINKISCIYIGLKILRFNKNSQK